MKRKAVWKKYLSQLYTDTHTVDQIASEMSDRFGKIPPVPTRKTWLDEQDSVLITYGDTLIDGNKKTLRVLTQFLDKYIRGHIPIIHLLPIFQYSSDDGFSVIDYYKIRNDLGTWDDIEKLSNRYQLMLDAVINHISSSSNWFLRYLECIPPYRNFFITCDRQADYSKVTRPRALPLLTPFDTREGRKYVWTTFSSDQIDLNYHCPEVLVSVLEVLLTYARRGARIIRLDAIGFLWKEQGTSCMHLPQTHAVVKLARAVLEDYAPGTLLLTETNVPQSDNLRYFGSGSDEAHLIYQFPLPPLVMFSFLKEDASRLTGWAQKLEKPAAFTTYFNFLASHDGIGLKPVQGILDTGELQLLVDTTMENGGDISYKDNGDGTRSPYELNINYLDALSSPYETDAERTAKFTAAHAILLSLQGLPGIYIHSLLGSHNYYYGKTAADIKRRINREKLDEIQLEKQLDSDTNRAQVFRSLMYLIDTRRKHPAFSPDAAQQVLILHPQIFALARSCTTEQIVVVINVSKNTVQLDNKILTGFDIVSSKRTEQQVSVQPFGVKWIVKNVS